MTDLLKDILDTLNSLPNRKVVGKNWTTYDLAKRVEQELDFQKWLNQPVIDMRDDLELWDYAISLGYEIDFNEQDETAGRTSKENIPHHTLTFKKEGLWIWQCGQSYPGRESWLWWQARNHINGHLEPYETRREYNTLKEALDNE